MEKKNFYRSYGELYENVIHEIEQIFKEKGVSILYFGDLKIKVNADIKSGKNTYEIANAVQIYNDVNDDLYIVFYSKDETKLIAQIGVFAPNIPLGDLIFIYEQMSDAYKNNKISCEYQK